MPETPELRVGNEYRLIGPHGLDARVVLVALTGLVKVRVIEVINHNGDIIDPEDVLEVALNGGGTTLQSLPGWMT